jgi:hypothetical protein
MVFLSPCSNTNIKIHVHESMYLIKMRYCHRCYFADLCFHFATIPNFVSKCYNTPC